MKYVDYFAPEGWTITKNPSITDDVPVFSYMHENYDGKNGLCGVSNKYLDAIHGIFELIRLNGMSEDINGKPAPDLHRVSVKLLSEGPLDIKIETFSGNTYTDHAKIILGRKNGKRDNRLTGNPIWLTDLHKSPIPYSPRVGFLHPSADIECGGWCTAENKEKYIEHCKEVIRSSLEELIDLSKRQLLNLMHPSSEAIPTVNDNQDDSLSL